MKPTLTAITPILIVMVACSACLPYSYDPFARSPEPSASPTASSQDPRFYEFVFESDEEPTVKTRTDSINVRWPNTKASEAHVVIANSSQTGFLPDQDPEFWLTAVATIPDETIQLLASGEAANTLLPGIHPSLYEYVPQECQFTTIDPSFADKALAPNKDKIPHDFGPMTFQGLAMSEDCHLLVFTALGHS